MMTAVERLREIEPAWAGLTAIALGIAVLLLIRRLLSPAERRRTHVPLVFLGLALLLRFTASRAHVWVATVPEAAALWVAWGVLSFAGVVCVVIGLVGLVAVLVFDVALRRSPAPAVVRDLVQAIAIGLAILALLYQRGFDPFSLVTTSAVAGAILGLALQNTIANVFAGIALPIERTLAIGDWIQVGGHEGRIREIKWRATAIVTKDGDTVIVPNNQLLTTDVTNFSRPTRLHRIWVKVGFHYRHPPNEVRAVLLDAARSVPGVVADPPPDCMPIDFADSAVLYAVRLWIDDFQSDVVIGGEARTRIWYAARRAGLEIPFPIRTIVQADRAVATAEDGQAERLAALARVDLFASIDGACRTRLADAMREVRFGAGETIIRQDDPGDSLYLIHRGEVDVHVSADGGRTRLATLRAGDFFGEMSLMTGEQRRATCSARTDTVCFVVDRGVFGCVTETRPSVLDDISAVLAARQTELEAGREGLTAEARLRREGETRSRILSTMRKLFRGSS